MNKQTNRNKKAVELLKDGKAIYSRLQSSLESRFKGKIVAIDAESGAYAIGDDELKAAQKAEKKSPGKKFAFFRVGYPVVHKLRKGNKP